MTERGTNPGLEDDSSAGATNGRRVHELSEDLPGEAVQHSQHLIEAPDG